jgi:hypothetical protein
MHEVRRCARQRGRVEVLALVTLWLDVVQQLSWWMRPVATSRKGMIGSLDGTKYDERSISPAPVNALLWR